MKTLFISKQSAYKTPTRDILLPLTTKYKPQKARLYQKQIKITI